MLQVRPGRNVWLLGRTDRDAPDKSDAQQTAASQMAGFFDELFFAPGQDLNDDVRRYYIGPARPIDFRASQTRPTLDTAMESWRHEIDQGDALAVRAERPWFVVADFDWRGPTKDFAVWPRRSVDVFGLPQDADRDLDWLLLQASWYGESSARRPDSTFVRDIVPGIAGGLSGLAILALVLLFRRK